jgi:predicted enzyme related to lactoylglutathione lyase
MFQGLRTVIYHVPDLAQAKVWYSKAFNTDPYFDEPFYIGFSIGGYELGLNPDMNDVRIGTGVAHMTSIGAQPFEPITDVGEGIKVASVVDPFGNVIGLIENPNFGR